jgi:hypothetical protein
MNVRIKHTISFTAGVYYGDETRMNNYYLTMHMITNSSDAVSHNVAFERMKYFVYNCLDSTVFVNQEHNDQCQRYLDAGISITTMPGEPVDQLIGLMLYYKLNALMEDRIIVDETEINSALGENIVYLHSENEITDVEIIPDWWTTADVTHCDYVAADPDKILSMPANTAWRELDLLWPEPDVVTETETGNIVVFRDFKPVNDAK